MYRPQSSSTMARAGQRRSERPARAESKSRRCLSCSQWFDSAGVGERVCGLCKLGEDWMDAMAACHSHIVW